MSATVKIRLKSISFEGGIPEAILEYMAAKAEVGLTKIGPHVVDVAQARTPVSGDRNFKKPRAFQRVQLRPSSAYPPELSNPTRAFYEKLASGGRAGLIEAFKGRPVSNETPEGKVLLSFFQGTRKGRKGLKYRQSTLGKSPDIIAVKGNTLQGHFRHKSGTLKAGTRFIGVRREGNRIIGTVVNDVPYALYVHEGFNHVGGEWVPGQDFLGSAVEVNAVEALLSSSTYEG